MNFKELIAIYQLSDLLVVFILWHYFLKYDLSQKHLHIIIVSAIKYYRSLLKKDLVEDITNISL